ncbi:hypothetical protein X011_18760 [Mycobacterium tuberculosis variant microti OV254]|nr:hypothetical protein X011_18760 [Mycobacterium tuberculosis variant microti OV254]
MVDSLGLQRFYLFGHSWAECSHNAALIAMWRFTMRD